MVGATQRDVVGEACRRSFPLFARIAFGIRFYCAARPDDSWWDDVVHGKLCDWLQAHTLDWEARRAAGERTPKKLLICIPRGYGKSTLVTAAYNTWLHLRNPELVTAISSFDETKSIDFLRVIQATLSGDAAHGWFASLYGSWKPTDDRAWRKEACVHAGRRNVGLRDPSFFTTSVGIGSTGFRPDVFCLDDPVVEEKLTKEANWIEKAKSHVDAARFSTKTNGLWVVALTRYRDDDVAGKLLLDEGVASWAETGMRPEEGDWRPGGPWHVFFMSARDAGERPTLPRVWPEERLAEAEAIDPMGFAAQMMNLPAEGAHMPVRKEHIDRLWVMPADVPDDLRISVHLDTAFKDKDKVGRGDYNVIEVWGHSVSGDGLAYYLDGRRDNTWGIEEFTDELVTVLRGLWKAETWPFIITDDRVLAQATQAYEQFLLGATRAARLPLPRYLPLSRAGKAKEARIREAAYAWTSAKVRLVRGANCVNDLVSEMRRIGISAHDDMADAAADVFHPEVYTPEAPGRGTTAPVVTRPYDALMWTPTEQWTDEELRKVYDKEPEEEYDMVNDWGLD